MRVRDSILPIARMSDIIGNMNTSNHSQTSYAVIVGWAEKQIGLLVDSLLGQKEIVIKTSGKLSRRYSRHSRFYDTRRRKRHFSHRCRSIYRTVRPSFWKSSMISEHIINPSEENIIKVIVIDDSAFMRKSLTLMLESDPEIKIIATARDGNEGIEKIHKLKPDIVTLDIDMPGMDGLTALKIIMEQMPVPVLMVSSLTTEGAQATMQAFDLGAVDFISKDLSYVSTNIKNIKTELIEKVKQIVRSSLIHTRFRMRRLAQSTQHKSIHVKPASKKILSKMLC